MTGEAELRAAIVAEAMSWLGTPYHHRAKLKGVGVDCAQVVLAVYAAVGIVEDFDTGEYPADWHIHRDVERYVKAVIPHGHEIPTEAAQPGDLVLRDWLRTDEWVPGAKPWRVLRLTVSRFVEPLGTSPPGP
jgi:cell wall-associated NlpC family hydrolase